MTKYSNSINQWGSSVYTVDSILGSGHYSTIQEAIDDANAAGGGKVLIKNGPYTENLIFKDLVDIIGISVSPNNNSVSIVGSHTFPTGGLFNIESLNFTSPGSPVIELNNAATDATVIFNNCYILSTSIGLQTDASGFTGNLIIKNSRIDSAISSVNANAPGSIDILNSEMNSINAGNLIIGDSSVVTILDSEFSSAGSNIQTFNAGDLILARNCKFVSSSGNALNLGGGSAKFIDCEIDASDGSGNAVTAGATFAYAGLVLTGSAKNISSLSLPLDWKPYATTSTVGTASFLSTDFNVSSSGQVSLVTPSSFTWTDVGSPVILSPHAGYFVTAAVTVILNNPAVQGDQIEIVDVFGAGVVVQAGGTAFIELGNSVSSAGGTATSSAKGDSLLLVYRAADTTWWAKSSNGSWSLA